VKKSAFIPLKNNPVAGKVMTRFPPEPSGFLHIGHAKALVLNAFYAKHYNGVLRIRFDDTNPCKEKVEFEESILEDLATLGIVVDKKYHSYTSSHFDTILKYCDQLIRDNKAFCDPQPQELQKEQRYNKKPSPHRDADVKENLRLWDLMQVGPLLCVCVFFFFFFARGCSSIYMYLFV
jgi:glutamyl-tRNA synthetase